MFDQLEEIELGVVSIFTICSALKEFISSLPGNILDCIKDKLEESILEPEKFIEKTKKLLGTGQIITKKNTGFTSNYKQRLYRGFDLRKNSFRNKTVLFALGYLLI